jgi:dihydrofolate reductase
MANPSAPRAAGGGRPLIAQTFVTLDGYMVGPDEDISWVVSGFERQMQDDIARAMSEEADVFLFGRMTYEMFAAYWPNAIPYDEGDQLRPAEGKEDPRIIRALGDSLKVVFSRTLERAPWQHTRIVRDGLEDHVRALKREPGVGINIQGSASVVQALQRADLIDEYALYRHPVLLGAGKPLFAGGMGRQDLELIDARTYANGAIRERYRRRRVM